MPAVNPVRQSSGRPVKSVEADDLAAGKALDDDAEGGAGGHAELERHAGDRDQARAVPEGRPCVGERRGGREMRLDEGGTRRGGSDVGDIEQVAFAGIRSWRQGCRTAG